MFKSHDQSVKLEIFRIRKHGIVFRLTRTWSRYHIWRQGCGHPNNIYNNNGFSSKNSLCTCIKFSWQACAVATRLTPSNLVPVSLPNVASFDVLADANDTGNETEIKKSIQHKREWTDKAVATIEPDILFSHGANAHSHTIVIMETNKANLQENVAKRWTCSSQISGAKKNLQRSRTFWSCL